MFSTPEIAFIAGLAALVIVGAVLGSRFASAADDHMDDARQRREEDAKPASAPRPAAPKKARKRRR